VQPVVQPTNPSQPAEQKFHTAGCITGVKTVSRVRHAACTQSYTVSLGVNDPPKTNVSRCTKGDQKVLQLGYKK